MNWFTELKQCSSDYDAISNVIVPRIERLPQKKREELAPLYNLHLSPRYRDIYRPIKKYTKTDVVPNKPKFMSNIYSTILSPSTTSASTVPIDWSQIRRLRECYKMAFLEKSHDSAVNPYDILVDVPWGKANNRMVMVLSPDGRSETPITELSHLKETIFDQPTVYLAPIRVYVSPKLHEKFSEHLTSIIASAEEHFYNPRVADNDIEYDE